MKRVLKAMCVLLVLGILSCCTAQPHVKQTVSGALKTYHEMSDGTWQCDGLTYAKKLVISGRMPNAAVDSTFVYLTNLEDISFRQAYMAAGLSSLTDDYFAPEDAVLVDWITGQSN